MAMVKDEPKNYEIVDSYELLMAMGKNTRWSAEAREVIEELRTLPEGKAVKRKFTDSPDQKSFAAGMKQQLKKFGLISETIVAAPPKAVDGFFVVLVGKKTILE